MSSTSIPYIHIAHEGTAEQGMKQPSRKTIKNRSIVLTHCSVSPAPSNASSASFRPNSSQTTYGGMLNKKKKPKRVLDSDDEGSGGCCRVEVANTITIADGSCTSDPSAAFGVDVRPQAQVAAGRTSEVARAVSCRSKSNTFERYGWSFNRHRKLNRLVGTPAAVEAINTCPNWRAETVEAWAKAAKRGGRGLQR